MLVMDVGIMGMTVGQDRMRVLVRMRFPAVPVEIVGVPMVLVVDVAMRVVERCMSVRMLMPLLQV